MSQLGGCGLNCIASSSSKHQRQPQHNKHISSPMIDAIKNVTIEHFQPLEVGTCPNVIRDCYIKQSVIFWELHLCFECEVGAVIGWIKTWDLTGLHLPKVGSESMSEPKWSGWGHNLRNHSRITILPIMWVGVWWERSISYGQDQLVCHCQGLIMGDTTDLKVIGFKYDNHWLQLLSIKPCQNFSMLWLHFGTEVGLSFHCISSF